jgi:hypothetical protein
MGKLLLAKQIDVIMSLASHHMYVVIMIIYVHCRKGQELASWCEGSQAASRLVFVLHDLNSVQCSHRGKEHRI